MDFFHVEENIKSRVLKLNIHVIINNKMTRYKQHRLMGHTICLVGTRRSIIYLYFVIT